MLTIPAFLTDRQQEMQLDCSRSMADSLAVTMNLAELKSREYPDRPATVYFVYRGGRLRSVNLRFEDPAEKVRDGNQLVPYACFVRGEQVEIAG